MADSLSDIQAQIKEKIQKIINDNVGDAMRIAAMEVGLAEIPRMKSAISTWYSDYTPTRYKRKYAFYNMPNASYYGKGVVGTLTLEYLNKSVPVQLANYGIHGTVHPMVGKSKFRIFDDYVAGIDLDRMQQELTDRIGQILVSFLKF